MRSKMGQTIIEYALLISVVAAVFTAMQLYVNRAVQGRLKAVETQLNEPVVLRQGN